jgi:hypothetical protein
MPKDSAEWNDPDDAELSNGPLTRPGPAGESAGAGHPLSPRERAVYLLSTPGFQPKMWDTLRSFTL